jgi:hypothetical protein
MRGAMLGGSALVLGGGAYVGGAFDQGEYYAMAPAAVEARLASVQFGEELGPAEADDIKLVLRSRGPSLLRWDLMIEGERIASVRANLAPDGTGTRVLTDFAFAKGDALMGLESDPLLNEVAEIAMAEKIDSTLDGRAFNRERVGAKLALVIASDPAAVERLKDRMEETSERRLDRLKDDLEREREYGAPTSSAKPTYGKPTMSAKPQRPEDLEDSHADGGWGKN